jgi:chemotaxis protein CheY-P-specific phosphatase CheC
MATADLKSLRRRYNSAKSRRSAFERTVDEIEHFMGPMDDGSSSSQGSSGTDAVGDRSDVWDHTAIEGREKLTASIHGSIIPSQARWFQGSYRKATLNKDEAASAFRDEVIEEAWNALGSSDFYTEMARTLHDLTGPGNGFISYEPIVGDVDPKTLKEELEGLDFNAIPLREAFHESDRKGDVRVFWRRHMWTASEATDFYLSKDLPVPEDIQKRLEQGNSDPIEFVYCVFPREKILKRKKLMYPAAPENRPWGCVWWREDTGEQAGDESGYYERPIYYCPWARTSGSRWGHGPGTIALPTVKYVNGWKEQYRLAGEIALEPPFLTSERNNVTDVDLRPGRGSVVRDVEGMKPFISGSNFFVAEKIIAEDIAAIKAIFRTDDLSLKESPAMTAMEVQVRYEIMNRLLGKTLTFIQTLLLGPIIKSVISTLMRTGRITAEMPASVKKAGGVMTIEYQGPLARSQRTDEVAAVERWITTVYGMAQFDPRIRAAIDVKKVARYIRERLGIPADLMPTDAEMDKRMKEIDEMQARAMAAESMAKEAKANRDNAGAAQAGPVQGAVYPQLPPEPHLSPSGRVVSRAGVLQG